MSKEDSGKKGAGEQIEYTREQILELAKCANDFKYFTKFCTLKTDKPTNPDSKCELRDYQLEMADMFVNNRFCIVLSSRQSGKTTTVSLYILWYVLFNEDKYVGIVSNNAEASRRILAEIKEMYLDLPNWLKPGVDGEWNKTTVVFENGMKIKTAATSANSFRGWPISLLVMDEFAFVPQNLAETFWASNYPTISASANSQILIISTPQGQFNQYHTIFSKARTPEEMEEYRHAKAINDVEFLEKWDKELREDKRNAFVKAKYDWRVVPGRDEKWESETISNVGRIKFSQEFECEFIGSTYTVITADTIKRLYEHVLTISPLKLDLGNSLKIYEYPDEKYRYLIGVDPSKGSGKHAATMQIIKILKFQPNIKVKQVATYSNDSADPYAIAQIANRLSRYYNNANIFCEANGEGSATVSHIWWTFENPYLYNEPGKNSIGFTASTGTKSKAVIMMKRLLENDFLELTDLDTINQLSTYIEDNSGRTKGQNGLPDDLVSSLYWSLYAFSLPSFFEENVNIFTAEEQDEEVWGILSDINDNFGSDLGWSF